MGIQDFGTIGANASQKEIIDVLADLQDTLNFLLNGNLDVKNLRASSITADRLKVTELSAITANLGHITAGLIEAVTIYGAYIATSDGTYPRIEFSSVDRLLKAYSSATRSLSINPSQGGTPAVMWEDGSLVAYAIAESSIGLFLKTFIGDLTIEAAADLNLRGNILVNDRSTYTGSFTSGTQTIVVNQGLITGVFP